jgi:hypothetical protein
MAQAVRVPTRSILKPVLVVEPVVERPVDRQVPSTHQTKREAATGFRAVVAALVSGTTHLGLPERLAEAAERKAMAVMRGMEAPQTITAESVRTTLSPTDLAPSTVAEVALAGSTAPPVEPGGPEAAVMERTPLLGTTAKRTRVVALAVAVAVAVKPQQAAAPV